MKCLFEGIWQETDPKFIGAVDEWVVEDFPKMGANFAELLKGLPGVYPSEALESVRRLTALGKLSPNFLKAVLDETSRKSCRRLLTRDESIGARLEHPLDFEWLFSKEAKARIIHTVDQLAKGQRWTVLCMGCPSIFKIGSELNNHNFRLLDKNATSWGQLSEAEALTNIDLVHDTVPDFRIDAAIIDPPWYNDFYQLFIWSALRLARQGAKILISVPQKGTRPSAERDVADLLSWCSDCGLALVEHDRRSLSYRAPLFELNALKAQGILNVPYDWRRGDLLVFEKTGAVEIPRPVTSVLTNIWREGRSGLVRLKFKESVEASSVPVLRPIVRNAVIPSVSTRFPRRDAANFVTSGNRFFVAGSTKLLAELCEELSETSGAQFRPRSPRAKNLTAKERMRTRLQKLFQQEQKEAEIYLAETRNV
jgi:hypothetical protein